MGNTWTLVGRCELNDGTGRILLSYVPYAQERPTAEQVLTPCGVEAAVSAAFDQLRGWWVVSDDVALTAALLEAGAVLVRHAHLYRRSLSRGEIPYPTLPSGFRFGPMDATPLELGALAVRAYPLGHLDFETADPLEAAKEFVALADGALVGPFRDDASGLIRRRDRIIAVCIINEMVGDAPDAEPWVSEVFREAGETFAGTGALVLQRAIHLLAEAGETSVGLAVTDGNSAEAVYRRLGFRRASSTRKLLIPEH